MSVSGISSTEAAAAYTQSTQQTAKPSQAATQKDMVSISSQAQQLAKDGDSQYKEANETAIQKVNETLYGTS